MVEAQTWTTQRMSNPRLDTTANNQVLDIPATPPGDVRNNNVYTGGSYFSPTVTTALIIVSWYFSPTVTTALIKFIKFLIFLF